MKYKDNCGVDSSTLEKGYSDTGYIPEDGESVFEAEKEDYDCCMMSMEETETGGFLKRNNYYDRI